MFEFVFLLAREDSNNSVSKPKYRLSLFSSKRYVIIHHGSTYSRDLERFHNLQNALFESNLIKMHPVGSLNIAFNILVH